MVSWFLKMFLKILKPFAKLGIIMSIIQAIEDQLNGDETPEESTTDPAAPADNA